MSRRHPSLGFRVHAPGLFYFLGRGAVLPIVPLAGLEMGASGGFAAALVALIGFGQVLGDLPAAALCVRLGDKLAMVVAAAATAIVLILCVLAASPGLFAILMVALGFAGTVFGLARQSYLVQATPPPLRGRALSVLAGAARFGNFGGPLIGALLIVPLGTDGSFWFFLACSVVAGALAVLLNAPAAETAEVEPASILGTVRGHARVLIPVGLTGALVIAVNYARLGLLPLWGAEIDLTPSLISAGMGAVAAVEATLFYPAGWLMDRFGRRVVGGPAITLMAVGYACLILTNDAIGWLAVAAFIAIASGMTAGLVGTMAADTAPARGRQNYLGAFRLLADLGVAAGPGLVAGLLAIGSLGIAALAMGAVSLGAVLAVIRWGRGPIEQAGESPS